MDYLKNKKFQKLFLIYSITFLTSFYYYENYLNKENVCNEINNDNAYSTYSKGSIYIGDKEFLDNLDNINEFDILVEDQRDSDNPTMQIKNSYLITDSNTRKEILEILCDYEKKYPSDWNRTIETMDLEWEAHNILYYLNYKKDHTTDVDLDNNDEKKYMKILKP